MALEARLAQLTDVQRQRSLVDSELVRRGTNAPFRNEVVVRFARTTPPTSQPAATPNIANFTEAVDKTMALRHDVREAMQSLTLVQRFLRRASEPLVTNTGIAFPACISNHVSSQEGTLGEASVRSAALLHRLRQGTKSSSAAERFAARTNPSAPTQVVEPVGYLTVAVNRVPLQGPGATRVVSIGTANVSGPDSSSHPRDPPTDNIKADAGRGITEVQLPAVTKSGEAPSGRSDAPPATPENADHSKPAPKPALGFAGAGKTTSTSFATPPPKGGSALAFTAKTAAPQPVASKSATVESAQGDQASDVVAAHAPNETPTKKDVAVPVATPQTTPPPALALPGGSKSAASMPAPFKAGHIAFTSKPAAAPKSDTKDAPSPDETPIKQEPAATVAEADGTEDTAIPNVASAALLVAEDIASTPSQTPSPSVDGTSVQARPPDDGTAAPTTTALKANPVAKAATLTALAKPAATAATAAPAADGTATSESVAPTATAPKANAFKSATLTAFAKPAATAAPAADGTAAPAAAPGADGGGEVPTAATPPKATAPKSTFSGISPSNTTFGKNKKDDDDDDGDDDGGDKGGSSVALPAPPTTAPMKKTAIGTSPGGFNKVASAFGATTPSTTATGFKSGFAQPKSAWGAPPAQPQQPKQQQQPPPPTQSAFGGKSSFAAGVATPPPASSGGAFKSAFGGANPWQ